MAPAEHSAVDSLRRALLALDSKQAIELLLDKIAQTSTNQEFLQEVRQNTRPKTR